MKKLLIIMTVMMVMAIAAPAFAAEISYPTGTSIAGATYVPSANVTIQIVSTVTNYSATSAHASSRSGAGYQFWILSTDNAIKKKAWVDEDAGAWPFVVTSATTTLDGFQ